MLAVLVALDLSMGDFEIPVGDVVRTLLGGGDAGQQFIVMELRLPQTLVAILVGCALGLSGALTQTFARNPLASPDILGVTEGAALGAVAVIVLGRRLAGTAAAWSPAPCRPSGSRSPRSRARCSPPALLYVLSWRRGIDGQRLVLIGIGLSFALGGRDVVAAGQGPDPGRRQRPGLAQRLAQRARLGAGDAAAVDPRGAGPGLGAAGPLAQRPPARRRLRPRARRTPPADPADDPGRGGRPGRGRRSPPSGRWSSWRSSSPRSRCG